MSLQMHARQKYVRSCGSIYMSQVIHVDMHASVFYAFEWLYIIM